MSSGAFFPLSRSLAEIYLLSSSVLSAFIIMLSQLPQFPPTHAIFIRAGKSFPSIFRCPLSLSPSFSLVVDDKHNAENCTSYREKGKTIEVRILRDLLSIISDHITRFVNR